MSKSGRISFITPLRGRDELVPGFLYTIESKYTDYEIIIAKQVDERLFRHGQLRNLGFGKSAGNLVVFIDIDVRLLDYVDFEQSMNTNERPLVMFSTSYEIREDELGKYVVLPERTVSHCIGRLLCFTRKQFESCGGYSNLCAGYGWEDNTLHQRASLIKVPGRIGHVMHKYQRGTLESLHRNRSMHQSDSSRDSKLDGFRQTIAVEEPPRKISERVFEYNFRDIWVPEDFAYREFLPDRCK